MVPEQNGMRMPTPSACVQTRPGAGLIYQFALWLIATSRPGGMHVRLQSASSARILPGPATSRRGAGRTPDLSAFSPASPARRSLSPDPWHDSRVAVRRRDWTRDITMSLINLRGVGIVSPRPLFRNLDLTIHDDRPHRSDRRQRRGQDHAAALPRATDRSRARAKSPGAAACASASWSRTCPRTCSICR